MLNIVKMDLYRLFHMKGLYITWFILILMVVMTTYLAQSELEQNNEATELTAEQETNPDNLPIGISVSLPNSPENRVSVTDLFYANLSGKIIAIFIGIFSILFATSDIRTGYIKNIGGQVKRKYTLVISKSLCLFLYTVATMLIFFLFQTIINQVILGYVEWGNWNEFIPYLGIQILLHFALSIIAMTLALVLNNNILSVSLVLFLCMNVFVILYGFIDKLAAKIGYDSFHTVTHTVTGKISLLTTHMTQQSAASALTVGLLFVTVFLTAGSIIFQKRDIR